ncbi:hypothetical protein ABIB40_002890 [Pedobacter sp. UYP30]|uniref:hypothetical protein n=1 Tax=Pedobacter sp. UYP30 TaxID=1756400 RepID=UPI0033911E21
MKAFIIICSLFVSVQVSAQTVLPAAIQIKTALLAAPPELRADATVIGYSPAGKFITLKKGTGALVCLADDPKIKGIKVASYSVKLEPFMARGRQLAEEGKTALQKKEIRDREVKEGKLKIADSPTTLTVYSGKEENYNPSTGELKDGNFRYVVYVPYATLASSGLPAKPSQPGMPWLMYPGTYDAHIMISPPEKE